MERSTSPTAWAVADFVARLAAVAAGPRVRNPYHDPARRTYLIRYLGEMARRQPVHLLVGEAPGYRGCARTGIPFTSESIMRRHPFFTGWATIENGRDKRPLAEATATMVWGALDESPFFPLFWNAYPFHPYRLGNPQSNRSPTARELREGARFLGELIDLFHPSQIAAVGRQAESALTRLGIPHTPLRHPSRGGKQTFIAGLAVIFAGNRPPSR